MTWFWNLLILFVVLISGSFAVGYVAVERMPGREATRRNLHYIIPWLFLGFALAFVISLSGRYGWVSFRILYYILSIVGISGWLISWFFRKQEAGALLVDIERTALNNFAWICGLLGVAIEISRIWSFFRLVSSGVPKFINLELQILELIFWWSIPSYLIAMALNKLEFREHGICYMYSLIKWQQIISYSWDGADFWDRAESNVVLTIQFKPSFPLVPKFMNLTIPDKHKDVINHILDERLSGKGL